MYSGKSTINEIMNDEIVMAHFEYMMPLDYLRIVPDELKSCPIDKVKDYVKMPWGVPYIWHDIVRTANNIHELVNSDDYEFIQLWSSKTSSDFFPSNNGEKSSVGLLLFKKSFKKNRKMALIVPGGAYMSVAVSNEGLDTAEALERAGYAVSVLNYRCAPNHYPIPQIDLTLAIKHMRYLASEFDFTDDLTVVGFSAGGHLVASQACYSDDYNNALMEELAKENEVLFDRFHKLSARPNNIALAYPVINFVSDQHEDSFINLTGGNEELCNRLSIDLHISDGYPKTFIWACDDDDLVPPSNAARMYHALKKAGVDTDYRAYPTGGHGIATGEGTSA